MTDRHCKAEYTSILHVTSHTDMSLTTWLSLDHQARPSHGSRRPSVSHHTTLRTARVLYPEATGRGRGLLRAALRVTQHAQRMGRRVWRVLAVRE